MTTPAPDSLSNIDFRDWFATRIKVLQARYRDMEDLVNNGHNYTEDHRKEIEDRVKNYFINEFWDAYENLPNTNLWTKTNER